MEPSHHDGQYQPIRDLATHISEEQQQKRSHTPDGNVDKNGYMTSLGKPRQPKTTQENKKEH